MLSNHLTAHGYYIVLCSIDIEYIQYTQFEIQISKYWIDFDSNNASMNWIDKIYRFTKAIQLIRITAIERYYNLQQPDQPINGTWNWTWILRKRRINCAWAIWAMCTHLAPSEINFWMGKYVFKWFDYVQWPLYHGFKSQVNLFRFRSMPFNDCY